MGDHTISEKEHKRQKLSRLLCGWIKLSKMSLGEFAQTFNGSRPNLFAQISDPMNSRKMSVELLAEAAKIAGVHVDPRGQWHLFNGKQQWLWKGVLEKDKGAVLSMLALLKHECGSPQPFQFTRLELLENPVFNTCRQHAHLEIADRDGVRLNVILVAEDRTMLDDATSTLLGSGLFVEQPTIVISPEVALQYLHGSCERPEPFPTVEAVDWNDGVRVLTQLAMRGISPRMIAEITSISLPKKPSAPPTRSKFVDDGSTGFTKSSDSTSDSWKW